MGEKKNLCQSLGLLGGVSRPENRLRSFFPLSHIKHTV